MLEGILDGLLNVTKQPVYFFDNWMSQGRDNDIIQNYTHNKNTCAHEDKAGYRPLKSF